MMNIIKNIFESLGRIILIVVVFFIGLFIGIPMFSCNLCSDESGRLVLEMQNFKSHMKLLGFMYSTTGITIKLDKNICYTFFNYYIENKDLVEPISCDIGLYAAKLIKEGKKCFIYKLRLSNVLDKNKYKKLLNTYHKKSFILGNYNSGKKCGKGDYEKCNMYITERGILEYTDKYECK